MLELGCGDGVNALAIAQTLPGAHVTAVDSAASAIERGRVQRDAAGLHNLELMVGDLSDPALAERVGEIDYVIAHGVFSWVPPGVRGALLELTKRVLAPHGIAYVSYNAYPGSYLRDMGRDILEFHLRGVSDQSERLDRAQTLMRTIVAIESPSPYARVLREQLQRMLDASDALLLHDDLAEVSTAFYFHEFIERANKRGLQFLSEAELSDSQMRDVPDAVSELMGALPADVVVREQHLDFFRNRMFRQTLLVHDDLVGSRQLDEAVIERAWISSPARRTDDGFVTDQGGSVSTRDPLLLAVLSELSDIWPEAMRFDELLHRALLRCGRDGDAGDGAQAQLRTNLLEMYLVHVVVLTGARPPLIGAPGEMPLASPLARAQCRLGMPVISTLRPSNHGVADESQRRLIALADGTQTVADIAEKLEVDDLAVRAGLEQLGQAGLLFDPAD